MIRGDVPLRAVEAAVAPPPWWGLRPCPPTPPTRALGAGCRAGPVVSRGAAALVQHEIDSERAPATGGRSLVKYVMACYRHAQGLQRQLVLLEAHPPGLQHQLVLLEAQPCHSPGLLVPGGRYQRRQRQHRCERGRRQEPGGGGGGGGAPRAALAARPARCISSRFHASGAALCVSSGGQNIGNRDCSSRCWRARAWSRFNAWATLT